MKTMLVENGENKQRVYDSLMLDSKHLGIFSNDLAVKIINELAKQPLCAMDVAKKLRQNEQKIYYHLRKMRNAGIVKLNGTEQRYGMTAKIFELVSPVIATKLYDQGYTLEPTVMRNIQNQSFLKLMHPFLKDGKLDTKIIIGDSYAHGRFDAPGTEGPHVFDFAVLLGNYIENPRFPLYELDTEVSEKDLKDNIILIGNPRTNVIIDKINANGHKYFDHEDKILSVREKKLYENPRMGVIIKDTNPINKNKKMLIIGGVRTRGLQAAIIALTQNIESVVNDKEKNDNFICIVEGLDKDGDKRIDSMNILE